MSVGCGEGVGVGKGERLLDTRWVSRRTNMWDDLLYSVVAVGGGIYLVGFVVTAWMAWRFGFE